MKFEVWPIFGVPSSRRGDEDELSYLSAKMDIFCQEFDCFLDRTSIAVQNDGVVELSSGRLQKGFGRERQVSEVCWGKKQTYVAPEFGR